MLSRPPGESIRVFYWSPGDSKNSDNADTARDDCAELFMLLPTPLIQRVLELDQLRTYMQLSPGYFQAPSKVSPM